MHILRFTWSATVLITLAAACGVGVRDRSVAAHRAADTLPPGPNPKFRDTASQTPSHAVSSVGGEPLAVCDTVANAWRSVKGTEVTRAESTFYAFAARDTVLGCHVSMVAAAGLPVGAWHASYWGDSLSMGSVGRGWVDLVYWDGDGPGSLSRMFMRNGVRCHVSNEFDPGSDDASTHVPSPRETQVTSCWLGPVTLTPRDTGG